MGDTCYSLSVALVSLFHACLFVSFFLSFWLTGWLDCWGDRYGRICSNTSASSRALSSPTANLDSHRQRNGFNGNTFNGGNRSSDNDSKHDDDDNDDIIDSGGVHGNKARGGVRRIESKEEDAKEEDDGDAPYSPPRRRTRAEITRALREEVSEAPTLWRSKL